MRSSFHTESDEIKQKHHTKSHTLILLLSSCTISDFLSLTHTHTHTHFTHTLQTSSLSLTHAMLLSHFELGASQGLLLLEENLALPLLPEACSREKGGLGFSNATSDNVTCLRPHTHMHTYKHTHTHAAD